MGWRSGPESLRQALSKATSSASPCPYTDRSTRRHQPALVVSKGGIGEGNGTSAENRAWPGDVSLDDLTQRRGCRPRLSSGLASSPRSRSAMPNGLVTSSRPFCVQSPTLSEDISVFDSEFGCRAARFRVETRCLIGPLRWVSTPRSSAPSSRKEKSPAGPSATRAATRATSCWGLPKPA